MLADELQGRIAALPAIASIKIPGLPAPQASERVAALRQHLPSRVTLGVSGDAWATAGLQAGCEASVFGLRRTLSPLLTGAGKSDT